jgi:hypothetical protein
MTELTKLVSEEDRLMVITKLVLHATEWLLEFIGRSKSFNANDIWRQGYELSKQLQDCSQRHISNPLRDSLFQIITLIGLTASREEKAELPLQREKAFLTSV